MLEKIAGGAIAGGAQAGMVNPDDVGTGAAIGAALPPLAKGVSVVGENIGALFQGDKNAAKQIIKQLDGEIPVNAPTVPQFQNIPDVKPTAGMITNDPALLKLEMNARNRNKGGQFFERDAQNTGAMYNSIQKNAISDLDANKLQDVLNAQTGQLRDEAFQKARENPVYREQLTQYFDELANTPGIRNSEAMPLIERGGKALIMEPEQGLNIFSEKMVSNADPEDIYTFRKLLSDKLNLKTISPDELDNAIKARRELSVDMIEQIDAGLNKSSGRPWSRYLKAHQEGMKPITEGRAFQNILDRFANNKRVFGSDVPQVTPQAFRKAVDDETFVNMGKKGYVSNVSDEARAKLAEALKVMNGIEQARSGVVAVNGSPTASYANSLLEQGANMATGSRLPAMLYKLFDSAAVTRGQKVLDDALLNPEKLQGLLNKAMSIKNARPNPALPYIYRALPPVASD
jgi:hypothetical protein